MVFQKQFFSVGMSTDTAAAAQLHAESYTIQLLLYTEILVYSCTKITIGFDLWFAFDILHSIFFTLINNYDEFTIIQKRKRINILTSGNN